MRNIIVFVCLIVFKSLQPDIAFAATVLHSRAAIADTLPASQLLYNGRLWRDIYVSVREDQFLFTSEFLPGTVRFSGAVYKGLKVRYDLLLDEMHILTGNAQILQINREMTDEFTLEYAAREYRFRKLVFRDYPDISGFVDIRYEGQSLLFLKHKKEISKAAPGKSYENFVQTDRIYVLTDSIPQRIKSKRDLFRLFGENRVQVTEYMKKNGIKVSSKVPDSMATALRYFDSINNK